MLNERGQFHIVSVRMSPYTWDEGHSTRNLGNVLKQQRHTVSSPVVTGYEPVRMHAGT